MQDSSTNQIHGLSSWQICAVALFYALTLHVGLNGDLLRYENSLGTVFSDYFAEPFFALLLLSYSQLIEILYPLILGFKPEAAPNYTLITPFCLMLIAALIFRTRKLEYAVFLHSVICLDVALSLMPFNLIRQFAGFVILIPPLLMSLNNKGPSKRNLLLIAIIAALTHWTYWVYVLILAIEFLRNNGIRYLNKLPRLWLLSIITFAVLCLVFINNAELTRLSTRLITGTPTLPSPGNFICLAIAVIICQTCKRDLEKNIAIVCTLTFGVAVIFGADALIFERHRILFLPVLVGILLRRSNDLKFQKGERFFKLGLLSFLIANFIWTDVIVDPFNNRDYFDQLL